MEKVREKLGEMKARINAPAMTAEGMRAKALWPEDSNKLIQALEMYHDILSRLDLKDTGEATHRGLILDHKDCDEIKNALARVEEVLK